MHHEAILVLDFGGQYNQLIARRVRENNVYCEVLPYSVAMDRIRAGNYKGIIFTGGPPASDPKTLRAVIRKSLSLAYRCSASAMAPS